MSATITFAQAYGAQLANIRAAMSGQAPPAPTPWRLPNVAAAQSVTLTALPDFATLELHFRPRDLYLLGYSNATGMRFAFDNQVDALQNSTATGFGDEYKDMGIDRDGWVNVPLDELETTLWTIAESPKPASKKQMGHLVIGFCEAARFADIERSVVAGTNFDGKLLKWASASRAPADKLLEAA